MTITDTTATARRAAPAGSALALPATGVLLVAVCYGLARFAFGLFVPSFRAAFGLDAAEVGAIASGSYAGYCVAIVLASTATSRWGARAVAVGAGLTAAVGTGLVALAPSAAVLAVGVLVAGSSTGLVSPPLAEAVARTVAADRRSRVQTVVNAGTGVGVLVSGPVALMLTGNWRLAWAGFAAVAVLASAAAAVAVPRSGPTRTAPARTAPSRTVPSRTAPAAGWGALARPALAATALGVGSSAVWTFGRDLAAGGGTGDRAATLMWIVLGACGLLGAAGGDVVRRVGIARAWTGAMAALGGATVLLAVAPGRLVVALAGAAVFGAVYIGLTGVLLLWGAATWPDRPATGVGIVFLVLAAGQGLGSSLVGVVAGSIGLPGAVVVAGAVLVAGCALRPRPDGAVQPSST